MNAFLLQIYFRLWAYKIYQNRLRFARVIDKSLLLRFLCPAVYYIDMITTGCTTDDGRQTTALTVLYRIPTSKDHSHSLSGDSKLDCLHISVQQSV